MSVRERKSGNEAVAIAMRQINPDVVGAFPITPSTEIPEYFSGYVADGLVDTGFIPVESEHSAMSTCIGASAAGARAMTATSSCGLAYVGAALCVGFHETSYSYVRSKQSTVRSYQHQQRPFGLDGRKRFGLDTAVCRNKSGGL